MEGGDRKVDRRPLGRHEGTDEVLARNLTIIPISEDEDLLPLSIQNAAKRGRGGNCNTEKPRCPYSRESGLKRSKRCFGPKAEVRIRKSSLTAGEKISLPPRNYFGASFMVIKDISTMNNDTHCDLLGSGVIPEQRLSL